MQSHDRNVVVPSSSGHCKYSKGRCKRPPAVKHNGTFHTLCEVHRSRSLVYQRNHDKKMRAELTTTVTKPQRKWYQHSKEGGKIRSASMSNGGSNPKNGKIRSASMNDCYIGFRCSNSPSRLVQDRLPTFNPGPVLPSSNHQCIVPSLTMYLASNVPVVPPTNSNSNSAPASRFAPDEIHFLQSCFSTP